MTVSPVAARPVGFRMPTHAEFVNTCKNIAKDAMLHGKAHKVAGLPKGAKLLADMTPRGMLGSTTKLYQAGMKLYVVSTPVVPHPKPTVYEVGSIPLF